MRKILMMLVLLAALLPVQATADTGAFTGEFASKVPVAFSAIPGKARSAQSPLLLKIQGYSCRACRRRCVEDFKIDCYDSERWCRRQFVRCMRQCWEDECR